MAGGLLVLLIASFVLSVNTFPVMTNDSVFYLEHSHDLLGGGLVENGYRQVGYPFTLAVIRTVSGFLGAEPLLAAAVLQRVLLIVAGYLSWRSWRWWSLPILVFFVAAETLAFTGFLLTESLAMSLAVILVFPTVRFVELMQKRTSLDKRRAIWLGGVIVAFVVGLFSFRFTYAVFGAVPLTLAVAGWRTPYRRITTSMLGVTVMLMGVFTLVTSLENRAEHDVFAPSVRGEAVRYYFAWQQVFTVRPENRIEPDLDGFYNGGFVHQFNRDVDAMALSPSGEQAAYNAEIEAMLEAAGIPPTRSKLESSLFALQGGRLHDLHDAVDAVVASRRSDVEDLIYLNQFAMRRGPEEFVEEYNGGQLVEAVITDPIGVVAPVPSTRSLLGFMLPAAIGLMLLGLAVRRTRALATVGLLVVVAFALGLGWIWADNLRFLMPTSAFGLAIASGVLVLFVHGRSRSIREAVDHDEGEYGELVSHDGETVDPTPKSVHPSGLKRP